MKKSNTPTEGPSLGDIRQPLLLLPSFAFWNHPDNWQSHRGPVALAASGAAVYLIPLLELGRWPSALLSAATCVLVIGSIERFLRWRDGFRRRRQSSRASAAG